MPKILKSASVPLVSLMVSTAALFVSMMSAYISWRTFSVSQPNVQIVRSSFLPKVQLQQRNGAPLLTVEYSLAIVNWSASPTSIISIRCESGRKVKPSDLQVSFRFENGCNAYEYTSGNKIKLGNHINVGAKQSIELRLVAEFPAPKRVRERYSEFVNKQPEFDDEAFLLHLAAHGEDFFGNQLGIPHNYLQLTFGKNFCIGGSIIFDAETEDRKLREIVDYYVGRISPPFICGQLDHAEIGSSVPFKRDLYTSDQPL